MIRTTKFSRYPDYRALSSAWLQKDVFQKHLFGVKLVCSIYDLQFQKIVTAAKHLEDKIIEGVVAGF